MATLSSRERAALPDRAFAYVDSEGQRRLPIHDAGHVRNALARFNQVSFEDDAARDRARIRLLTAAKRFGIMPIGFLSSQLNPQQNLPTGHVTFLLADIEGSTGLLAQLDDRYAGLLADVRKLSRKAVRAEGGHVASARGDDVVAVFEDAACALAAAVTIQREMQEHAWPDAVKCRLRIGLHSGRPQLTDTGYVGISVHAAARICFAAHGGQILMSAAVRSAVGDGLAAEPLGAWRFRGLPEPIEMFEARAPGLASGFGPLRGAEPVG
jgi:class 3 adenylate cyclase